MLTIFCFPSKTSMMRFILLYLFLGIPLQMFSQSLTIDETVKYLNKLSSNHPIEWDMDKNDGFKMAMNLLDSCKMTKVFRVSFDNNLLKIYGVQLKAGCSNSGVKEDYVESSYFNFQNLKDFKIEQCSSKNEILVSAINYLGKGKYESSFIYISLNDINYLKVYYNGLRYLASLIKAQAQNTKETEVEDPFATKRTSNTESRILIKKNNGVVFVPVRIGNLLTTDFVFDSGAGECSISSQLEKQLIKNGIIKKSDYLSNGLYKLADGTIIENRRVNICLMQIGNKIVKNIIASIGDTDSPNLLGQSFLAKLKTWSINNDAGVLTIK